MKKTLAALALLAAVSASAAAPKKTVRIEVSGGFYKPATVTVKKGQPVRLEFVRDAKPTCGDELVIESLKIRRKLEVGKPTIIDLKPTKDLKFSCGMDMMQGKIVVQ